MPRTGDKVEMTGEYEGVDEHACIVKLDRGDELPSCPNCSNSVEWKMVSSGEIP
jgi:hypothetical protein